MEITELGRALEDYLGRPVLLNLKAEGTDIIWAGHLFSTGYGLLTILGKPRLVHRLAWEATHGAIPPNKQIDHVKARGCLSRACCNPDHLEIVTLKENVLRGDSITAENARKLRCINSHPLDGGNLYIWIDGKGNKHRICRECVRTNKRAFRARQKAQTNGIH